MLEQIKKDLSNFPEEVITLWLLPYAEKLGWPPSEHERWNNILADKPLSVWQKTVWEKRTVDLSEIPRSRRCNEKVRGMFEAFVLGRENDYSRGLGEEGKNKFISLLKLILETGVFPEPPILYEDEPDRYDVLDGNHRYIAYIMSWRIWEEIENLTPEEKKDKAVSLSVSKIVEPVQNQEVWFCENVS